ncbi:hypothetical protein Dimus_019507 [Dionaea muscipula]
MKNQRKKKRRAGRQKQGRAEGGDESKEERIISSLVEAFSLASVEEAKAAYKEANGDPNRAAEILRGLSDNKAETSSAISDNSEVQTYCSYSSRSSGVDSSSSEGLRDDGNGCLIKGANNNRGFRGKKMVAATGMVSTLLGKEYAAASSRTELRKEKGWSNGRMDAEDAGQFLCSILGDGCELSMGVVKDVLGHCGYDVEKALDMLLDLHSSISEPSAADRYSSSNSSCREDSEHNYDLTDRGYDSTSHSSGSDIQDYAQVLDYCYRDYLGAVLRPSSSSERHSTSQTNGESELPEKVLRSLFNIPERSQHEPGSMNWRNVVKQVESFAQRRVELYPPRTAGAQQVNCATGAEYQALREPAKFHWETMKSFYQKAALAHANGAREYASHLSEQGKLCSKLAQKEDEKASMEIFKARNKDMENVLTIDLHGQHVKQAIRLVKLHLLFGTYISSVQYLRVITGCGTHGMGKSKLKESVISLLEQETIHWEEENRGTVIIRLDGPREFSFLDSETETD